MKWFSEVILHISLMLDPRTCSDTLSYCLFYKLLPDFKQHYMKQSINFLVREILFACEIKASVPQYHFFLSFLLL